VAIHAFTLPPVNREGASCQKCGMAGPAIRAWFCSGLSAANLRPLCANVVGEHVHRTCSFCGNVWFERPLDLQPPNGVQGPQAGQ
jgi:hypothetical protein